MEAVTAAFKEFRWESEIKNMSAFTDHTFQVESLAFYCLHPSLSH